MPCLAPIGSAVSGRRVRHYLRDPPRRARGRNGGEGDSRSEASPPARGGEHEGRVGIPRRRPSGARQDPTPPGRSPGSWRPLRGAPRRSDRGGHPVCCEPDTSWNPSPPRPEALRRSRPRSAGEGPARAPRRRCLARKTCPSSASSAGSDPRPNDPSSVGLEGTLRTPLRGFRHRFRRNMRRLTRRMGARTHRSADSDGRGQASPGRRTPRKRCVDEDPEDPPAGDRWEADDPRPVRPI